MSLDGPTFAPLIFRVCSAENSTQCVSIFWGSVRFGTLFAQLGAAENLNRKACFFMDVTTSAALSAQRFHNDPQVITARRAILDALHKHQQEIDGVRAADPALAQDYAETVAAFSEVRGGNLYFPYLASGIGRGALVELADGSVKYDFISGIGVHHLGHSHPKLVAAALDAALGDTIMLGNLQQNEESFAFSRELLEAANTRGAGFDHCFLTSTGVMAGENALKIAMQKKHPADRVLAFEGCFAGRTTTFSQITDKPGFRAGLPSTLRVDFVPFCDATCPQESTAHAVTVLKRHLARYPGQHAAMVMELVQGEGGFNLATADFHRTLMQVLREHGVAVLVDEVQTFARTPELFAFQYYELDDLVDLVWIGKASQVCATLYKADYKPKPGLLSQTFTASATAMAAGRVILDELLNGDYFGAHGKVARLFAHFESRLKEIADRHPDRLSGPYGIGAMVACTPLDGDAKLVGSFVQRLYGNGVMSFVAGSNPTRARFLVPVGAVEPEDIDKVCTIFESTLVSM